jgi:hypothetical protein
MTCAVSTSLVAMRQSGGDIKSVRESSILGVTTPEGLINECPDREYRPMEFEITRAASRYLAEVVTRISSRALAVIGD